MNGKDTILAKLKAQKKIHAHKVEVLNAKILLLERSDCNINFEG